LNETEVIIVGFVGPATAVASASRFTCTQRLRSFL